MQTNAFADFVARQQTPEKASEVDWTAVRDEWLRNLTALFKQVNAFLEEYIAAGQIRTNLHQVTLYEESLGEYTADQMDIDIGKQRTSLVPIGTMMVGSRGRVDVDGPIGRAQLWLTGKHIKKGTDLVKVVVFMPGEGAHDQPQPSPSEPTTVEWVWKVLNVSRREFFDLDRDTFTQLLMEVANG